MRSGNVIDFEMLKADKLEQAREFNKNFATRRTSCWSARSLVRMPLTGWRPRVVAQGRIRQLHIRKGGVYENN